MGGTGTGDLHERRRANMAHSNSSGNSNQQNHHHLYEHMIVTPGDSTFDSKDGKKKRRTLISADVPLWAIVVVTVFVFLGILLAYFLLHHRHRRVILHVMRHPWAHGGAALRLVTTRRAHNRDGFHHHFDSASPRFVTVVLPSVVNPQHRPERLRAIHDTWGPYARAIYVVHNGTAEFPEAARSLTISETSRPHDPYLYPQNLLLPNHIRVEDGIHRLVYTIQTIYRVKNPDFAFFVNDHTFVIPEHVCRWLDGIDPNQDLYAGHALKNDKDVVFNSGAAGYILSRETMRRLVAQWSGANADSNQFMDCGQNRPPDGAADETAKVSDRQQKWLQGNPGLVIASCLYRLGVHAIDTRELRHGSASQPQSASRGGHIFHAFPLTRVVTGAVDDWYVNKHKNIKVFQADESESVQQRDGLLVDASYATLETGPDCCAAETVSFHYVERYENRALFAIRVQLRNDPHMTDQELQSIMMEQWPTQFSEIGGYSRGLPKVDDIKGWSQLMATVRKISVGSLDEYC